MTSIIIPDIHNKVSQANQILEKEQKADEVILLGDIFDSMEDTMDQTIRSARWLKQALHQKNVICLFGNHDIHYYAPAADWLRGTGHNKEKEKAIRSILTEKDWEKFQLCYLVQNEWLCSHAGFQASHLIHPVLGFEYQRLKNEEKKALERMKIPAPTRLTSGDEHGEEAGPLWQRWNNFEPTPGINQIFGHTSQDTPQWKNGEDSQNLNLDTHLNYYAKITDKILTIESV
jgi:hypothetical protein